MIPALKNLRTYEIAIEFHRECQPIKLTRSLRDQLTRATESIVLNLAEGSAKPTPKDRARFYAIALGSFRESQAILSLGGQDALMSKFDPLGGCLYRLAHPIR